MRNVAASIDRNAYHAMLVSSQMQIVPSVGFAGEFHKARCLVQLRTQIKLIQHYETSYIGSY